MRVTFIRLSFVAWILLLTMIPVLAQDDLAGEVVTQQDWLDFMPVVIGAIVVVLIVDAFFIMPIFRKNDQDDGNKST